MNATISCQFLLSALTIGSRIHLRAVKPNQTCNTFQGESLVNGKSEQLTLSHFNIPSYQQKKVLISPHVISVIRALI